MSNIPENILVEILIRLPWKSLMRFRCVSKSICALIRSQSFVNSRHYFSNTKNNISILVSEISRKRMFSIDYNSISSLLPLSTSPSSSSSSATVFDCDKFINWMDYPSLLSPDCEIKFLGSRNGLLCICCISYEHSSSHGDCYHDEEIHLWNPSTKQYKKLPTSPPRPLGFVDNDVFGFGYDYKFDNYKLVRFNNVTDDIFDLDVYSLKSNSWETIQNIPYSPRTIHPGVLVNGALHWFAATKGQDSQVLISFDIVNERFNEVALPEEPIPNQTNPGTPWRGDNPTRDLEVAVLGGCLCLLYHVFHVRADVWVMQDYGVKESWTKSFSITEEAIINNSSLVLVWSFKNDEILVQNRGGLWLYDPKNKTYKELRFHKSTKELVADKYMGSMVPLN